jgi:hypothetical protein
VILTDIRRYLEHRGQASLGDIARHLDADPEAVRGMLEHWMRKGRVRRHLAGAACGGCSQCEGSAMEVYEWLDDAGGRLELRPVKTCRR